MAVRPMIACARCSRPVEASRAFYAGGAAYCSWAPCAKSEQQRLAGKPGRVCGHCGGPLSPHLDPRAIWCSARCQRSASRARLASPAVIYQGSCGVCGEPFTSRQPSRRFCSRR